MTRFELCDGSLAFYLPIQHSGRMHISSCPEGQRATVYDLDLDDVRDLIEALERMAQEMGPRAEAKKSADAMARDLHDAGWTFKRFSDAFDRLGVYPYEVLDDVGDELSRLDKEGGNESERPRRLLRLHLRHGHPSLHRLQ